MKKQNEAGGRKPNPTEQKDFLKRGHQIAFRDEEVRRENLVRLIGTDKFPTWKSVSDALEYKDASRLSHLKSGIKRIRPSLARGMEEKLGLPEGYFEQDSSQTRGVISSVDRRRAAQRYLERTASARVLAKEFEVDESQIYRWVAEFRQEENATTTRQRIPDFSEVVPPPQRPKASGRSVEELEEENQKLRNKLLEMMLGDREA